MVARVPTRERLTAHRVRLIWSPRLADILPPFDTPLGQLLVSRLRVRFAGGALKQDSDLAQRVAPASHPFVLGCAPIERRGLRWSAVARR